MRQIKKKIFKILTFLAHRFHSKTYMKFYNLYLRYAGIHINGIVKFIHPSVHIDMGYANHIHIGTNCVISINSIILAHDYSIECGLVAIGRNNDACECKLVRDVHIGNNVFIGAGCIILPGTNIGNNCIIGAGTICSGKIPDNSIVTGSKGTVVADIRKWASKHYEQINKTKIE